MSTGSSDPTAAAELDAAAADLAALIGFEVRAASLATLSSLDLSGLGVAAYLLAEGRMAETISAQALAAGAAFVTPPIGEPSGGRRAGAQALRRRLPA